MTNYELYMGIYLNMRELENNKIDIIVKWLSDYLIDCKLSGFIVGVSGGIDSALVSTLCAKTKKITYVVSMPINQDSSQLYRARCHINWLKMQYDTVYSIEKDLSLLFDAFKSMFDCSQYTELSLANSKSRLRMTTLYNLASNFNLLVVGTGNKIEDYGVGFFTKYGDGGVDISPIGDLYKSQVYELSKFLGIQEDILLASPTDGLWSDNRTDESQIGATYDELEFAMKYFESPGMIHPDDVSIRFNKVINIYKNLHDKNLHKMSMPPICKV